MLDLLYVALFQTVAGEPTTTPDGAMGASTVEQAEPAAPTTSVIPEQVETPAAEPATEAPPTTEAAAAPAEPRTERRCRYERGGGASRTSRTLLCRDVVIRGGEGEEENDRS